MIKKILLSYLFIALLNIFAIAKGTVTGDVSLNIKEETLSAKLKYDYYSPDENQTEVKFLLNEDFVISKVKCEICSSFDHNQKDRGLTVIQLKFKKPLHKNERAKFVIEYNGKLGEMFNKDNQFLELGLDFFWIPYESQISEFTFKYRLNIKTDSPDYKMVGNGKTTKNGNNWLIESKASDFDINVIFAKDLAIKRYQEQGYDIQVVSKNMPDEVSRGILNGMAETLDFYNTTFGKNRPQKEVTAVFRPFDLELGYFRNGYFILPSPKKAEDVFKSISHELAHFWWSKANLQNDWLDESFAEYSAMLAVRKLRGIEKFNAILETKQKQSVNLPPIFGFDRTKNRQQTPLVLYVKGALRLYELEQVLGEDKFLQFMQKVEDEGINETDKLVEGLRKFASVHVSENFLANLKK